MKTPHADVLHAEDLRADVAVLGSGFSGSLMALVLQRLGLNAVVLDRATHPRFTIGESSTPIGNMILRDLAERYDLPRLAPLAKHGPWKEAYPSVGVGRKRGFSYVHHAPGQPFTPDPAHANELLVAASADPYRSDTHWLRAEVDAFLAGEVQAAGIPLLEGAEVVAVEPGPPWQIEAQQRGARIRCTAEAVIDATGPAALVPHALGLADERDQLKTHSRALYTHVCGLERWQDWMAARGARVGDYPYPCDEAALHHVLDAGWLWELRFDDGRVSAGLVLDATRHPPDPDRAPAEEWKHHLRRYPTLQKRFAAAEIATPPGRFMRTGRLQRYWSRAAGPRWAALPFTAGFIDPLHSTGIAHTLSGIERLARAIEQAGGWPSAEALDTYDQAVRRELRFIDTLVATCYAALPSFRAWRAATMLYFAAATTEERRRTRGGPTPDAPFARGFLSAHDDALYEITADAYRHLADAPSSETAAADFERFVESAIAPYNEVGLFDPPAPNMYPHTAALV